jgi:signal transduction histidine kinase
MKNLVPPCTTHPILFQAMHVANASAFSQATVSRGLPLQKLVNHLLKDLLPAAVRKRSLILNEIPGEFTVAADENMVSFVLWNLMNNVVHTSANECIHVNAERAGNCTLISLKHVSNYFYRSFSGDLRQVQDMAEKLGGCINIECSGENESTVTFLINDAANAA